ncbi:hypothetical protein GCM10010349_16010 [Streptomyces flavofungini]|nr:hypothetical protein GCM10010349_16010 [Streptomyces flavofungini]
MVAVSRAAAGGVVGVARESAEVPVVRRKARRGQGVGMRGLQGDQGARGGEERKACRRGAGHVPGGAGRATGGQ